MIESPAHFLFAFMIAYCIFCHLYPNISLWKLLQLLKCICVLFIVLFIIACPNVLTIP